MMSKKVAIISELTNDTINYSNRLQSYALNKYIQKNLNLEVTSLVRGIDYRIETLNEILL